MLKVIVSIIRIQLYFINVRNFYERLLIILIMKLEKIRYLKLRT